jgi:hypothetical protein
VAVVTAPLSKTAAVLELFNVSGAHASYSKTVEDLDEGAPNHVVHLNIEKYEDLGKPAEITVTIEPGNTLEDPA